MKPSFDGAINSLPLRDNDQIGRWSLSVATVRMIEPSGEAAVIGAPHPRWGEAITAVVVRKPGAALDGATIGAELKTQIANFKVPKAVFVVDDLPRNAMGKVQKNLLREQHQGLFAR